MLVVIDNSVCNAINSSNNNILFSLENIGECIISGKHIVLADRSTLKIIGSYSRLGDRARLAFKNLYYKITEIGDIVNQVDSYILVSNQVTSIKLEKKAGKRIFKVPVDYFYKNERLLPSNLVSEDLSDCEFYEVMVKKYLKSKNYKYKLNFRYVNGGGLNTHINYRNSLIQGKAPCLVIVDSDKESKGSSYGATATNVIKKYDEIKEKYITEYYILDVREKENMIPPCLYGLVCDNKEIEKDINILDKVSKNDKLKDLLIYGDIKSGIKLSQLIQNNLNKKILKEYLENEIKMLIEKNQVDEELLKYVSEKLDLICTDSVFSKVVNNICDENKCLSDIKKILEEWFNCINSEEADKHFLINGLERLMKKLKEKAIDISIYDKLKEKKNYIVSIKRRH